MTSLTVESKKPFLLSPIRIYRNLRNYNHLLRHLISRDLKIRYHNSIVGYGWSVLEPLALTVTFYILFAILSDDVDPYRPLSILLGILLWSLFAKSFSLGTIALQRNAAMIKKVYFPRELFLFSKSGYQIVQLSLSLLVILPLLLHYRLVPTTMILWLPVTITLTSMLGLGLAFFTSIWQTKARDVEHIVTIFLRISFYLTPVFYPLKMITSGRIPSQYTDVYLAINPMATYITMIRSAFTGEPLGIPVENLYLTVGSTVAIFWLGCIYFVRKERQAVKNL
ncbi:MAG TPA: ABC transporter permease [Candidatus Poseidoniaceae archaeon]|nr:hypothetical protein [Euryarchaeota archaeon]DAC59909.1 MAG TPA: hypothetical protein D7I07_01215 [Candidatus Poseidoniales archaeon]HII37101.1 ABC transporter permease [Candidatus Poseidoniaceae archaeon]